MGALVLFAAARKSSNRNRTMTSTRRHRVKGRGQSRKFLKGKFCRCIKKVMKTVKARGPGSKSAEGKEKAAIGICVKSVLGTRKRTLYKFSCKRDMLKTQNPFRK